MKRRILNELLASHREKRPVALVTNIESGGQSLIFADDALHESDQQQDKLCAEAVDLSRRFLKEQRSMAVEAAGSRFIIRVYVPPPRLLVVGAVHIAQALIPMAGLLGFQVKLIDPREAFSAEERFPGVELIHEWPNQALDALSPDSSTAVVTLSHDPKIDDPALQTALASDAFYVGALGSRKTHAGRLKRLSALGIDAETLTRIHAPVGLNLGGRAPAEIAVSILAQIIEARCKPKD
jgi:xanthine dehydrogenase accessory factor